MAETEDKPKLPEDRGQFGAGDATEDYKPLPEHPDVSSDKGRPKGGRQTRTEAGERS